MTAPTATSTGPRDDAVGARIPVPSGCAYRVEHRPSAELVRPTLARELSRVLERFARDTGFDEQRPVRVWLQPGVVGHHKQGRAADLYGVEDVRLDEWKRRWDQARVEAAQLSVPEARQARVAQERRRNLGWRLYKAVQAYGRWVQPYGYPIQLFGPWTRSEGPWRPISDRLLHAHRDHIHIAL